MPGLIGKLLQLLRGAGPDLARPGRFGVDELARRLGVTASQLRGVPIAYHTFPVPKRRGGMRTIFAPAPPLKAMQRRILHKLLARLSAHPCATGFERASAAAAGHRPVLQRRQAPRSGAALPARLRAPGRAGALVITASRLAPARPA